MISARQSKGANLLFRAVLLLVFSAITTSIATNGFAATASLSWTAPTTYTDGTPITGLGGYRVYTGTAAGSYTQNIDVGNVTTYTLSSLNDATAYYFAVTAYDASGEVSGFSNQAAYTTPAAAQPPTVYTLTSSAGSGGSITPSGSVAISQGLNQSFTISPNSGYRITAVTVDGASVGAVSSYTFSSVAANHTISATFAVNTCTITASAGTGGSISPAGTATVSSGGIKTFTITPATGYHIAGVAVDGASVGAVAGYTFSNVTANHTISATFATVTTVSPNIAHTKWSLKYVDSQETGSWPAKNAFDGNTGTFWHTQWINAAPACPHEIQINLGKSYKLDSFSYLPRQDTFTDGTIANYGFYVSSDGVNWGTAVATGTFANSKTLKQVSFPAKSGQYIRLRALSEVNGKPYTSAAEINVTGI